MELHIAKWGNSLALRLPTRLARELGVDLARVRGSASKTKVSNLKPLGVSGLSFFP